MAAFLSGASLNRISSQPVKTVTKPRPVSSIELGSEKGIRYLSARQAAADMVIRKIVPLSGEQEIRMRAGPERIKPA